MGMVITYLLYLLISIGITVFVGSALSRSGRAFLLDVFGDASIAAAVSRLLVVGFYLLNLGFVTLTLRATGEIGSPLQAVQVLSVKIGEMLLVIGALHFAILAIFTRLRRRAKQPPPAVPRARQQPVPAGSRGNALQ